MTLEKRAWTIGNLFVLLLVLLSLRIVYWQIVRGAELQPVAAAAPEGLTKRYQRDMDDVLAVVSSQRPGSSLDNLPQPVVQRTINLMSAITRGSIYDRNGRLLAADSRTDDGERERIYYEPGFANIVGYVSALRLGISGIEFSYNDTLLGIDRPDVQINRLVHKPIVGSDLVLTVDSHLQRVAERALENKAGAILVLDAQDGAVLAMVSSPGFDPNKVLDPDYVSGLVETCGGLSECQAPFLNRATQGQYPPGSTWKTLTLIAALDTDQVSTDTVFDFGQPRSGPGGPYYVYEVGGGVIPDPNHAESSLDLEMSYAKSANAAFARIGDEMPPGTLVDYAARFGFAAGNDPEYPLEIAQSVSQLAGDVQSLYDDDLLRAATAIGQGELLATPLSMGMVVLSVLNDGDLPLPYIVDEIHTPSGDKVEGPFKAHRISGLMTPETASLVRDMMVTVVERGSGVKAQIERVTVGGKTGTAQVGGDRLPHAWFTGFALGEQRQVVIVVLVENSGEGSQVAAPIFTEIAGAALQGIGQPVEETVPTPPPPPPDITPESDAGSPPAATQTPQPTLQATVEAGPLTPDLPFKEDKVDFIDLGKASCPGEFDIPPGTGKFIWPSQFQALSGGDFIEGHPGIDLSTPSGTPVYAADTGLVIFAGWTGIGYGNTIVIDHGNGFRTLYGHLSQVSTYCGAKVAAGALIGLSGSTGNSSGPHLHFEVRVPGGYINPLRVLPIP
jgi:peptidoglycan glycosyltransferase